MKIWGIFHSIGHVSLMGGLESCWNPWGVHWSIGLRWIEFTISLPNNVMTMTLKKLVTTKTLSLAVITGLQHQLCLCTHLPLAPSHPWICGSLNRGYVPEIQIPEQIQEKLRSGDDVRGWGVHTGESRRRSESRSHPASAVWNSIDSYVQCLRTL